MTPISSTPWNLVASRGAYTPPRIRIRTPNPLGCGRHCGKSICQRDFVAGPGEERRPRLAKQRRAGMYAVTEVELGPRTSIGMSSGAGQHRPSLASRDRLTPPIADAARVPRERLTTRLVESRERLVLVVAPAGYGKTTLAVQWSELDDRPFAWVALGAGMGDPARLWSSIGESIGRAEPTLAPGRARSTSSRRPRHATAAVAVRPARRLPTSVSTRPAARSPTSRRAGWLRSP